jgi:hypothetical protein
LLQDVDKLRERLGGGGERLDLLVCYLGQVPAENSAEPSAVILERDVPVFGQGDEDDASVAGPACPRHQPFLFELLDQDRDRWLRQALELSELPPRVFSTPISVRESSPPICLTISRVSSAARGSSSLET